MEPDDILAAWVTQIVRYNKCLQDTEYSKYCTVSSKTVHTVKSLVHSRKTDVRSLKLAVNLFELEAIKMNWHVCESLGKYKIIFPGMEVFDPEDERGPLA